MAHGVLLYVSVFCGYFAWMVSFNGIPVVEAKLDHLDTRTGVVNGSEQLAFVRIGVGPVHPMKEGDPFGVEVIESREELKGVELTNLGIGEKDKCYEEVRRFCTEKYACGWECEPVLMAVVARCKVETEVVRRVQGCREWKGWGCWKREKVIRWKRCRKPKRFEKCVPLVCFSKIQMGKVKRTGQGGHPKVMRVWDASRIVRYKKPSPKYDFLISKKDHGRG